MKHVFAIACLAVVFQISSCQGQDEKEKAETAVNPQTNISVNKEYDESGNLIRYDSTYSYFYSNVEGDTLLGDSIFQSFRNHFNQSYFFSESPFFSDFFFEDSLLHYDFYKDDFFSNRFRRDMERMDSIFRGMDSIKNQFFKHQFEEPVWQ
ncbi:MAG: hypothetical protein AB7S69_00615 [Salinivirgaceae bacterium]